MISCWQNHHHGVQTLWTTLEGVQPPAAGFVVRFYEVSSALRGEAFHSATDSLPLDVSLLCLTKSAKTQ